MGCCSKCDAPCFEGLPKYVGKSLPGAMRVNFRLTNASNMDLTFCGPCADKLTKRDYPWLWQRVILSWLHETHGVVNDFIRSQGEVGLQQELSRTPWEEVAR